jgi:hypothetical protein
MIYDVVCGVVVQGCGVKQAGCQISRETLLHLQLLVKLIMCAKFRCVN